MCPFHELFPDQAWKECRVMTILRGGNPPPDQYTWAESYCVDPDCDYRRVMLWRSSASGSIAMPRAPAPTWTR